MQNGLDLEIIIGAIARRVAEQVRAELAQDSTAPLKPRLLTLDQAAVYMGRSEEAMQHMVANGKVQTVRIDRRVFVDVRDLEKLIQANKASAIR